MRFSFALLSTLLALGVSASPLAGDSSLSQRSTDLSERENDKVHYLGSQSATLSGGTKFGDLVFVSGQVPLLNGTVVPGGIKNETAFVIDRVGAILAEDIRDIAAMNEVYAEMIPDPKPARATFEVGNLPVFGISIEMEAIAAV